VRPGQFKTSYAADMAIFPIRQDRIALALLLAFAFVGVPLLAAYHVWPLGSDYLLRAILIPFLILALAAIGVNILIGYCGQISLGSGAFMAIGAYSAYKFGTGIHLPLAWLGTEDCDSAAAVLPSILLGGLMSAIVGILFGVPSLRIKGLYLAVATLAAQFFFDWVFLRVKWFTNYAPSGSVNAPQLQFFGLTVDNPIERYLLCLAFVTVFAVIAKNLVRGNLGRQWMAIRDMDIAAELMGIRPLYAKLTAFACRPTSSALPAPCGHSSIWARGSRWPST
jgi:branched-chain amino acid transport system permease protein